MGLPASQQALTGAGLGIEATCEGTPAALAMAELGLCHAQTRSSGGMQCGHVGQFS